MALFILIFIIKSLNSKVINNDASNEFDSKKNESDSNSNNSSEKSRKKLIKLKHRNLSKSKKITRNNIIKIRSNFLIFTTKKSFN